MYSNHHGREEAMTSQRDPTNSQQERIRRLLAPERARMFDTVLIFNLCGIDTHDQVAEVGCGPGLFTVPLAKYVFRGKVYALDILDEMLDACRERVKQARLGNVEVLKCADYDFLLEKGSMDGAFVAFVIHQVSDRLRFLQAVRGLLRPGGWCCLLEYYRQPDDPPERRIHYDELEALAREVGFEPTGWRDLNGQHYIMRLRNV
jgi:ubiquinone/menaquinone biosynthesis C-methylase UbiE